MGTAIISKISKRFQVSVSEKDLERQKFLKADYKIATGSLKDVVSHAQVIVLAVKPQDFDLVLKEISECVTKNKLVISIAAGITTQYIEKKLGKGIKVVRAMPNLPAQIGQAMTGICKGKNATSVDLNLTQDIFNSIGQTVIIDEKWMDAITAVSGSGPAYVFLFAECFMSAAIKLGFSQIQSKQLVEQTLRGSLDLLTQSNEDAAALRMRVTSKGGTTQAAMDVFMKGGMQKIFNEALKAAEKRAKELAK